MHTHTDRNTDRHMNTCAHRRTWTVGTCTWKHPVPSRWILIRREFFSCSRTALCGGWWTTTAILTNACVWIDSASSPAFSSAFMSCESNYSTLCSDFMSFGPPVRKSLPLRTSRNPAGPGSYSVHFHWMVSTPQLLCRILTSMEPVCRIKNRLRNGFNYRQLFY